MEYYKNNEKNVTTNFDRNHCQVTYNLILEVVPLFLKNFQDSIANNRREKITGQTSEIERSNVIEMTVRPR